MSKTNIHCKFKKWYTNARHFFVLVLRFVLDQRGTKQRTREHLSDQISRLR